MSTFFKRIRIGSVLSVLFVFLGIVALASSLLVFSQNKSTNFNKKTIIKSNMTLGTIASEVGPGDSVVFAPCIHNDSTEIMYAFLKLTMPTVGGNHLYDYTVCDGWMEVESDEDSIVYAYVSSDSNMCELDLDETTPVLTSQISMRNISNAEYASIEDINISVDSFIIGINGVSSNPQEAWIQCKDARGS